MFGHLFHLHTYAGPWGRAVAAVVGVGLLATRAGRPVAKGAIKGGLTAAAAVRDWTSDAVGGAKDLYAESKAELDAQSAETAADSPGISAS